MNTSSGRVTSGGEEIHYEMSGDGDQTVVFCHGLGGNHAVWYQQVPVFAEAFRVVTWDQRGFGMSTNRASASGPQAAVGDLVALLDALQIRKAHLVGQSMGGWAVVGFALRHPDRVATLVVADSTGGIVDDEVMNILVTAERRTVDTTQLGSHPAIGEALTKSDRAKAFLYTQIGGFRGDVDDADMIGKLMSTRYPLTDVAKLSMPAFCIVGSTDDLIPPAAVARVASILGSEVVEIEGAGHSPYFERPDEWNRAVLGFLNGVASS